LGGSHLDQQAQLGRCVRPHSAILSIIKDLKVLLERGFLGSGSRGFRSPKEFPPLSSSGLLERGVFLEDLQKPALHSVTCGGTLRDIRTVAVMSFVLAGCSPRVNTTRGVGSRRHAVICAMRVAWTKAGEGFGAGSS
jgi:hypothetical protein